MSIAMILKAYPRLSESFILNEVRLLEARGVDLQIIALKAETDPAALAASAAIAAPIRYLPEDPTTTDASLARWLRHNLWRYVRTHGPVLRRSPLRYLGALVYALLGLGLNVGVDGRVSVKRAAIKDFLRAATIAAWVGDDDDIRHLHAHFCHGATTMAMLASQMSGRTYSFTAHAKDIYVPKLNPGGLLGTKIKRATFVATCTCANRDHLATLRPRERDRIHAIHHGLDVDAFTPPPGGRAPRSRPIVLSVGRHVVKKGFDDLLRAAWSLRTAGREFELRIVGSPGPETERLHTMTAELGLADVVRFVPAMAPTELADQYREADVFALGCRVAPDGDRDGIPNVLAEAMASGLAVAAPAISGIPELVAHDHTGLLVPADDSDALARAIARLLDDRQLRLALGERARAHIVTHFDADRTIDPLVELFAGIDPGSVCATPATTMIGVTS